MNNNITYHNNKIEMSDRRRLTGQKPRVIWFTGLSGSGKSTIAAQLEKMLVLSGYPAYLLDGDNLRFGLCAGLGFSASDRAENIRRITEAAYIIAGSGQIAIVSAISPMRIMREEARKKINSAGIDFAEVFVDTPIEECAKRDVKGLYKKAYSGEISDFTGVTAPYEAPENPEVIIFDTVNVSAEENAKIIYDYIIADENNIGGIVEDMKYIAAEAGKIILGIYGREYKIDQKEDNSPLTEADRAANDYISDYLTKKYPHISILTEESADDRRRLFNRWCFIVDPLDGTKEFIKRNGEFTVNIALVRDHTAVAGVIYVPVSGELYYASAGSGSYRILDGNETKLKVSDKKEKLIMMSSRSHGDDAKLSELLQQNPGKITETVSSGSSLKGCRIAEGKADIYYRFGPTMEWDTAAMQIICEEAGAIFRQLDERGSKMYYNRTHTCNDLGFYIVNREENIL